MQNPPPGPPPGNPPGNYPPAASSGINTRTGALLSYLLEWVTGIIFLFVGKDNPDVKFHAAQSLVWFGSLQVLGIIISIISNFNGLRFLSFIGVLIGLVSFISWLYCLYKAWTGNGARFELPLVGGVVTPYAEQLANSIN